MRATIRDVARRAGVAPATVSRVINNTAVVSETTRQRVLAAVAELSFVPNPIARRLSLGRTQAVAAIVPFFTTPSFVERLRGLEQKLTEAGYDLIVFNVETPERRDRCFAEVPHPQRVDGVVIMTFAPSLEQAMSLQRAEVPVVLVDSRHPLLLSVTEDSYRGGLLATQHLLELGHERIGYISDVFEDRFNFTSRSRLRYEGYMAALLEAGQAPNPSFSRQCTTHGREAARQMAHALLDLPERPTAIFAASDTQAMGVLEAARERGLRVPEELSVVGYDDIEIAAYLGLTTVRQQLYASGQRGAELLLEAIASPRLAPRQEVLPIELVVRRTTAPPPP